MRWRVVFVATLLILGVAACGSGTRPVPYTDVTRQAGPLEFTRIYRSLYRTPSALRVILEQMNPGRRIHLPRIDWRRQEIYLVAAGPRSSTGYDLRIVRVQDNGDNLVVVVRERTPSLGEPVDARVTYPFRLIALPRNHKPVTLKWLGRP
jgi:hypothetical protein